LTSIVERGRPQASIDDRRITRQNGQRESCGLGRLVDRVPGTEPDGEPVQTLITAIVTVISLFLPR
jgi:hypothetical protein